MTRLVNLSNQEVVLKKEICIGQLIEVEEVTENMWELVDEVSKSKPVGFQKIFGNPLEDGSQRRVIVADDDPVVRVAETSLSSGPDVLDLP